VETSDEQLTGWIEAASLSNCGNSNPVSVTTTPAVLENCTPRADWTLTYTVQPGNTLAEIARAAGVSLTELAQGNCIADVNRIVAGQKLRVPRLVIVVTPLPPVQPPAVTQEAPSQPEQPQQPQQPQITSGRWQLTITTQQIGCDQPPAATTVSTTASVTVSADANSLSMTVGTAGTAAPVTRSFKRSGPTTFAGGWGRGGQASLTVTGANQGTIYATVPCG
jgi:LysM repeat protein